MYHNVLLPVDPENPRIPPIALLQSLNGEAESHLKCLAVLEPFDHLYLNPKHQLDPGMSKVRRRLQSDLRRKLRVLLRQIAGKGLTIDFSVLEGSAASVLLKEANGEGRDLILLPTQSREDGERRIGALTSEILLRSAAPVCCFREVPEEYSIRRILVATDLSENSLSAFEAGVTLAEQQGAEVTLLHLLHGWSQKLPPTEIRRLHADAKTALKRWRGSRSHLVSRRVRVSENVVSAPHAAAGILEAARDLSVDLIVIASHGWSGLASVLFGSTARRVVRSSEVPVLVTRDPLPDSREVV